MNRRRFQRVNLRLDAEVTDGKVALMARDTRDLSLQGVFVATEVPFPFGTECRLTLLLQGLGQPLELRMQGKVVRVQEDGFAIQFHTVEDLESFHHLRNVVMYNCSDPDRVLTEVSELADYYTGKDE